MLRTWSKLSALVVATTIVAATGLAFADEDSPIHKLMEEVSSKSNAVKKATRTPVAYKKAQKDVVKYAEELIELGKKSRDMKESAEKAKKPLAEWQKLTDDFIKKTEEFKTLVSDSATTQDAAKKSYNQVGATCTACHDVFRVED